MTRDEVLAKLKSLKPWLHEQGIGRVRLFGSHARDEARTGSDVDLIVELIRPLGLDFFRVEQELGQRLGARVEMTTEDALTNRIFRRTILADAVEA